ncbi:MAG TPA: protein kinase [Streptosporangiaceae bacterium]|nr:protein kinase [Streptosporangiaceae bacterium]
MSSAEHTQLPGRHWVLDGRYWIENRIGAGGYSEVWRGTDAVLDRTVAIKLLNPAYASHNDAVARFRDEARHAGSLTDHNIARIYDFGTASPEHPPYLVMELVDGPSVADLLADGPLDPAQVMDVVAQTAAGLQAAHAAGLVHRDVKPGNLLIDGRGVVKITDFGISHAVGSAPVTGTGLVVGTPGYLAPERAAGAQATTASDIYALGMVAYECLTGSPPFTGTPVEVALAHRDRSLPPLPMSVPAEAADLVALMTAKDPADRPPDAHSVANQARWVRDNLRAGRSPGNTAATSVIGPQANGAAAGAARSGHQPTLGLPYLPPADYHYDPPDNRRRWGGYAVAALGTLAVVGLILIGVHLLGASKPSNPPAGRSPNVSTAQTVNVNSESLVGQPAKDVKKQLEALGMTVVITWQPGNHDQAGLVTSVQPTGNVPVGQTVTLFAVQAHGHGHDNGNGNGGDGGGG